MVADLCLRKFVAPGLTVVAMRHEGHTAGVCAWYPRPLPSADMVLPNDIYIHTIGLTQDYRGGKLGDGTWLSNTLMMGALRQIRAEAPNDQMPAAWVYIAPFNKKSHRLFRQHGYATRTPIAKHDIIRFRPPGLDPELYLASATGRQSERLSR
jgi:hypothetical protein